MIGSWQTQWSMTIDFGRNDGKSAIEQRLCTLPIFAEMSSAGLSDILKFSKVATFTSGQPIFRSGDSPRALYVLLDGRIEWTAIAKKGSHEFMGFIDPVEILVLESAFSRKPYVAGARAHDDARVLEIPLNVLQSRLRADPNFASALLIRLAERTDRLMEESAALAAALERFVQSER